ncbi:hypothetical protein GIB67_034815, partial [Kingdonia uniflora]
TGSDEGKKQGNDGDGWGNPKKVARDNAYMTAGQLSFKPQVCKYSLTETKNKGRVETPEGVGHAWQTHHFLLSASPKVPDKKAKSKNLTMSIEEEEYDGTGDEEESESDYSEGHVSQLRFLSGKKWKNNFEEVVNASIEPPPPLPQNYEARDFRQLTQPDGNGHLSTSARVGFNCRSVLVKLHKIYVILIEPTTHTFYLPCGELRITPRDFTVLTEIGIGAGGLMEFDESSMDYGNAIRIFPDMMPTDYEKGCISFAYFRTYLDHTKVNIRDPANAKTIFRAFMLLYFGGVLFGNSKSWARLELLCPIAILENKAYAIDFGSAILGNLYYCLDQASKQEYHCYKYCQIGHHILIDNRLDDFWPRMSAWQIKRRKVMGNKAKHHLALMRQQLDLRTINNMQ